MSFIELKIPEKYKEMYTSIDKPSMDMYARVSDINDIIERLPENYYEELFILFTSKEFDKEQFIILLTKIEEISYSYTEVNGFKGETPQVKDNNYELYFGKELQEQFERILYCSSLLIPFYDKKMNLEKYIYNLFWKFFDKKYDSNIRKKVNTYVASQLSTISVDSRYWEIAAIHGISPATWYQKTISDLTSKALMKLDLDRSYAIYCQVVARDSLMYITKQNFKPITLQDTKSTKILYDSEARHFLNMMIIEDSLARFYRKNVHLMSIEVNEKYSPLSMNLTVFALDEVLDLSSDVIMLLPSVKRDIYFKKVAVSFYKKHNLLVLSDIVKTSENSKRTKGNYRVFKHDDIDSMTLKQFNLFGKYIFDNSGNYFALEVRKDLQNLLNKIVYKEEQTLEDFVTNF